MNSNTKKGISAIMILLGVLLSCSPSSVLVEASYTIDEPLTISVGSEMIVIRKIRTTSDGNQILQAMADQPVVENINFIATLTYTGKSDSNIKIAYREFSGVNNRTNAQPAFYLDLEYHVSEEGSEIVSYRDIQIGVLKADSNQITYRVLDDSGWSLLPDTD